MLFHDIIFDFGYHDFQLNDFGYQSIEYRLNRDRDIVPSNVLTI